MSQEKMPDNLAILKILDAIETYKEEHNFRFGSIEDDLLDALLEVNKLMKENMRLKIVQNQFIKSRDSDFEEYETAKLLIKKMQKELDSIKQNTEEKTIAN